MSRTVIDTRISGRSEPPCPLIRPRRPSDCPARVACPPADSARAQEQRIGGHGSCQRAGPSKGASRLLSASDLISCAACKNFPAGCIVTLRALDQREL